MTDYSAETWVFIRGLLHGKRHWGQFPEQFKQHINNVEILCPNIAGNDDRYQEQSPTSIKQMVTDLRQRLELTSPCHLLGLSMGGMIAAEWARCYPEEIKSSVLINTSMRAFSPFYDRFIPKTYPRVFGPKKSRESVVLRLTSNRSHLEDNTLKRWLEYQQEYPVSGKNAMRQLYACSQFYGSVDKPKGPILLLAGKQDRLVNWHCSKAIAENWQRPLVFHPTAGHDLPLDEPMWVITTIKEWLEKQNRELRSDDADLASLYN